MGTRPVIIEVRLNEYSGRQANRHVPWAPAEIAADAAACSAAGASIVHFHGRDPFDGAPDTGAAAATETVRRIRDLCDVIVMPTLGAGTTVDPQARLAPLRALAADASTCPELAPVDLGSFNLDPFDAARRAFRATDLVYLNPVSTVLSLLEGIRDCGVTPMTALWSVGSARLLGALLATGAVREPVYVQLVLSEALLSTHPGTPAGLEALLRFLPDAALAWSVLSVGGNLLPLVGPAVDAGGHIAIGLGDHPYTELGQPTNAAVVEEVVRRLAVGGCRPATATETRSMLGINT